MTDDDVRFLRLALDQAARAEAAGEVPVGAVAVRDGELVAAACNAPVGSGDPTAHAEVLLLRAAARALGNYRLPGLTVYVTLEPCLMCVGALVLARVERVVFGAPEPKFGALGSRVDALSLGLNHSFSVESGVLGEECAARVVAFFRSRRGLDLK